MTKRKARLRYDWNKAPVRRVTDTAKIYRYKCKNFPVVVDKIVSTLGLPQRIIVISLYRAGWEEIVERGFKKVSTAQEAAERYATLQLSSK